MFRKIGSAKMWWVTCGIIVVGILIIGILAGIYYVIPPLGKPRPSVQILRPTQAIEIESGQAIVMTAKGKSISGIQRIDFLVNEIINNQVVSNQHQNQSLDAVFPWFSDRPGVHRLSVIAYDQTGKASLPDAVLVLVKPRMGVEKTKKQTSDAESEGADTNATGTDGDGQAILEQILQNIGETQNFPVDIPGQPQDSPPIITTFNVQTARNGNQVNGIYSLAATDELGIAYLSIIFSNLDDPLNPVSHTQITCGGESTCATEGQIVISSGGWLLSAQAVDTSGQASQMRTRQVHVLVGEGEPAIALEDEGSFIQLDSNLAWDEVQFIDTGGDDLGEPRIAEYGCAGQTVVLEIPYTYSSDHGEEVYVEARAENGNIMVAAGNVRIGHGSGVARFEMGQILQESINTESLELLLMASGGDYFYTEEVDFPIIWPTPQPDLRIVSADIRGDKQIISIQNMGCATVEGFSLLLHPLESAGETVYLDAVIPAGGTYDWLPLTDPNSFERGFQIILDPENTIVEINEENNSFEAGPLTLKYIHIYKIDIHDTRDDEWHQNSIDGEFQLTFFINGEYAFRPRVSDATWVLTKGPHEIGGLVEPVILSPPLDWNQDLLVAMELWEEDDFGASDQSFLEFIHSHDISQENNWKNGGTFSTLSDDGTFTLFWQLVVER